MVFSSWKIDLTHIVGGQENPPCLSEAQSRTKLWSIPRLCCKQPDTWATQSGILSGFRSISGWKNVTWSLYSKPQWEDRNGQLLEQGQATCSKNDTPFVKLLLECYWALGGAECLTMQNQMTVHLELPIVIWVLSDPERSGGLGSNSTYDGRGVLELIKQHVQGDTKGQVCLSSAHTYVHLEKSLRISWRMRKTPEHSLHMYQLGRFWWQPKTDGGCSTCSHTWKTIEKENPLNLASHFVWTEK